MHGVLIIALALNSSNRTRVDCTAIPTLPQVRLLLLWKWDVINSSYTRLVVRVVCTLASLTRELSNAILFAALASPWEGVRCVSAGCH
jgi:hypothetical protein